ncbi:hypothetical protein JCM16161A_13720 [Vulcanisaeta sp. JCM 16161]
MNNPNQNTPSLPPTHAFHERIHGSIKLLINKPTHVTANKITTLNNNPTDTHTDYCDPLTLDMPNTEIGNLTP